MKTTAFVNRVRVGLISLMTASSALTGCDDDSEDAGGHGGSAGEASVGASSEGGAGAAGSGGEGGVGGDAGGGNTGGEGGGGPSVDVLAAFDPAAFELPEGLAILGDDAYVGFAFTGQIDRFALADGTRSSFASSPPPPPNTSFLTGLTFDSEARLYGALVSFTSDRAPGIYRADAGGGDATLWSSHAQMIFPNGFAWGDDGLLYVTDSVLGGIFRIDASGTAQVWMSDALLAGNPEACGGQADDIAVGANGIVLFDGALYVASSDQGLLARVPIEADGSAGALELVGGPDCEQLAGIDGLTLDGTSILAAINRANRIVRITTSGEVELLVEGAPLDFPASLEIAGEGSERALYVTSFALGAFLAGGDPAPALLRVGL